MFLAMEMQGPGPKATVMSGTFVLESQKFMALNGGPMVTFSPETSFFRELRNAGGSR
jgi:predicted 3-demethylubiquinone-9 3-methyltransferase (glyoxalase superfamily)